MSDLLGLLLLLVMFGGSLIALAILAWGLFAAKRTSSVIACAVVAALLFAAQVGLLWLLYSFGAGWSGGDPRKAVFIKGAGVVTALLVAGFLALKLPRVWGGPTAAPRGPRDGARITAMFLVAYVVYFAWVVAMRQIYMPGGGAALPSLASLLTLLVALILAWGLWRHATWAWYGAVAGVVYLLARIVWFLPPRLSDAPFLLMSTPVGISLILLISALGVLLLSNARKLCTPSSS